MKRVLVAGATGGLGKKVLEGLKDRGYFARALVRKNAESEKIKEKKSYHISALAERLFTTTPS